MALLRAGAHIPPLPALLRMQRKAPRGDRLASFSSIFLDSERLSIALHGNIYLRYFHIASGEARGYTCPGTRSSPEVLPHRIVLAGENYVWMTQSHYRTRTERGIGFPCLRELLGSMLYTVVHVQLDIIRGQKRSNHSSFSCKEP